MYSSRDAEMIPTRNNPNTSTLLFFASSLGRYFKMKGRVRIVTKEIKNRVVQWKYVET